MSQGCTPTEASSPTILSEKRFSGQWRLSTNPIESDYEQVFDWYCDLPRIFRSFTIFKREEKKDFIEDLKRGRNYIFLSDGELKCMIHGEIKDGITIEGHLFCEPHTPIDLVTTAVTFAKLQALREFTYVVTQVIKQHPILHEVMRRSGFKDTGLRSYSHVYKNRLLEVVHYVAWNEK